MRFRKCTSIRVGKECQYSHTPQEEPTNVPREEEMLQANLLEEGIEATASALAEKQLASEATSARRTPPFDRAQAECDAVAKAKQDEFEATMNSATLAELAAAFKAIDEKKALARAKREKQKAENAASAGVANSGEKAPPTSPTDEQPTMANIGQVREGDLLASEREANASIAHYATANPEA